MCIHCICVDKNKKKSNHKNDFKKENNFGTFHLTFSSELLPLKFSC